MYIVVGRKVTAARIDLSLAATAPDPGKKVLQDSLI
jgi:hypothetical protein